MNAEQEILRIGKQLERIIGSDTPNDEQALDMLKALQGLPMTLDVLQKSRVGMSVNKLRQKCSGSELASMAKKLIKSWKKLLPNTPGHSVGHSSKDIKHAGTPKSHHHHHHSSSSSPSTYDTPTSPSKQQLSHQSSHPPTPPPVMYSPPSLSQDSKNGTSSKDISSNVTSPQLSNGEVSFSGRRLSSTSDDTVHLIFAPSVDGFARVSATGSEIRDRCRDMVVKALRKGFTDVTIEEDIKIYNLSAQIEECVYSEFRDTGHKYKMRIRSRVSNLGDLKNPALRQSVISGQITPSRIAVMSSEEMASDAMKNLRKQFTKDAIRDAQMATSGGTKTSLLKCGKCGKRNTTYNQAQTRSADEPMTTFAYCNECGHRWKFC